MIIAIKFPSLNNLCNFEAHFHLDGFINKQNCRIWSTESPKVKHQRKLNPSKCTVWSGITTYDIIGSFFSEDDDDNAVTVNGERYRTMLKDFVIHAIPNKPRMWFQQDGATCHTAKQTMKLLSQIFGNRIMSRGSAFGWPPRSPDLTSPDFFLRGYLKDSVYINNKRRSRKTFMKKLKHLLQNHLP